jgi:hypothetical protein
MSSPSKETSIDFLVRLKFGPLRSKDLGMNASFEQKQRFKARDEQAEQYRRELAAKPEMEILKMVSIEKEKQQKEFLENAQREEQERFYNQPWANADFDYWSKRTDWTLDEALALTFGKDPKVVNWERVKSTTQLYPFSKQYELRRELLLSAARWKQLYDPVLPPFFIGWARRMDVPVPDGLIEAVEKRGQVVGDWKMLYDQAMTVVRSQRETIEANTKTLEQMQVAVRSLQREFELTKESIEAERASMWGGFDPDASDYPRELDIALTAWRAITNARKSVTNPKDSVFKWLEKNCDRKTLSAEARKRIATVCNWEKSGGRPSRKKTVEMVSTRKK